MAFCGQCGYLLASNATKCPRCGAPIETPGNVDEMPSDAPTIYTQQGSDHIWQSPGQQGTAQVADKNRRGENIDTTTDPYHPPTAWEQTSTPHAPAGSFHPPQTPSYPTIPPRSGNAPFRQQGDISYPGSTTSPNTGYPENLQFAPPPRTSHKTSAALILAIIAFVLAAALATTLLLAKPGLLQQILQRNAPTPIVSTPSPTAPTPSPTVVARTPEQQAQMVIEQYFNNINHKNYQAAYNLWAPPPSSYNDFVNGFTHTRHDDIQLGTITQQSNGTVQVPIIITALTDTGTTETFSGYYVVGQQPDNSWKITGAQINPGTGS